jgi:hypothetical protein
MVCDPLSLKLFSFSSRAFDPFRSRPHSLMHWEPTLIAKITYLTRTADGLLRTTV